MNRKLTRHPETVTGEFERALNKHGRQKFVLRLFVTGLTPRSTEAVEQVRKLCEKNLAGRYELEIVDIYRHPGAAKRDQVLAAPTLIRLLPRPVRKFVGDMRKTEKILTGMEIELVE